MLRYRLKEVLEEKTISMTRLSRLADVNYKTIRNMVRDPYRDVAYSTLHKLSKALNVPISDLVEEIPDDST